MKELENIEYFDKNIFYSNLSTKFLGRNLIYYEIIDSTQEEIWKIAKNVPQGTLVLADLQTKGKGTHGKNWCTDEKNNIAFSFILKPNCDIKRLEGLTLEIAEIILKVFEEVYQIKLQIKKPNDIVYKDKKIGGILTETRVIKNKVNYLNIGIGINTNKENFPKELIDIASSIKKEFNIEIDNIKIITNFCNKFEKSFFKRMED